MNNGRPDPAGKTALERLHQLQIEVERLCMAGGRKPDACKLLPISKTVSPDVLRYLCNESPTLFGENKVQELKLKAELLKNVKARWHFVGHLQTNKVRECIQHVEMIHTVDRLRLVHVLNQALQEQGRANLKL